MNKIIDSDNLQIDENNELLERVQEAIEAQTVEVQSIEQALQNIADSDLPAMGDVMVGAFGADGKSGWISELLTNINKETKGLTLALKGYTVASAEQALKNGALSADEFNDLVKRLGYSFNETTGVVTTPEGSFNAHYKGWTKKSNNDVQLSTAMNGVQVTGGGTSNNSSGGGNSNQGATNTQNLDQIVNEVIRGKWGNGATRKQRLTAAGYDYNTIQALVNQKKKQGYFDEGGIAIGKGILLKDIKTPERVLSPKQTKAFDTLVDNLTSNPVLAALTKNIKGTSNFNGLAKSNGESKQYYFSNFTVQANNLTEFIDSLEGMIPITK